MTMRTEIVTAVTLSMSVGTGSYIISWSRISDPLRDWISGRARRGFPWNWLGDLLTCPFCVAVWLSIFATILYHPLLVHLGGPAPAAWLLDRLTTSLAIAGASMLMVRMIGSALGRYTPKPVENVWNFGPSEPASENGAPHANGASLRA